MSKPEDSPYYCKECKRVIRIAYRLHMWDMHRIKIIELKNDTKIYVCSDDSRYQHVTGKSTEFIKLDEFND